MTLPSLANAALRFFKIQFEEQKTFNRNLEEFNKAHPGQPSYTKAATKLSNATPNEYASFIKEQQSLVARVAIHEKNSNYDKDDFSIIRSYIVPKLDHSNLGAVKELFERGYFGLLHQMFKEEGASNCYWSKLDKEIQYDCIKLAIEAGEKELVSYLVNLEYAPSLTEDISDPAYNPPEEILNKFIPYLVKHNLLSDKKAQEIREKILCGDSSSNINEAIIEAIAWNHHSQGQQTQNTTTSSWSYR